MNETDELVTFETVQTRQLQPADEKSERLDQSTIFHRHDCVTSTYHKVLRANYMRVTGRSVDNSGL